MRPRAAAVPETATDDGTPILPPALTFQRHRAWPSTAAFTCAQRDWLRWHGITDPREQLAVVVASRRAHAETVADLPALDRMRRRAEGAGPDDPV